MNTHPRAVRWALWPLLALASGLYTVLPGSGYLILLLSLGLLLSDARFRAAPGRYWQARQVLGLLAFNAVFLLYGVWHGLEARLYVLHLFTLCMFLIALACSRLAFGDALQGPAGGTGWSLPGLMAGLGLLLLLLGQLVQMAGWLPDVKPPAATFLASLVFRPGGFHNSNMTAALALLFLLLPRLHAKPRLGFQGFAVLMLAVVVIGLTQSRAGLAALALYSAWLFRRHPLRILAGTAALMLVGVVSGGWEQGTVLFDLVQRFGDRFGGDASSTERAWLMRMALQSIYESPLFGHGYGFLVERYAAGGSHNQVIELLVAFGVVGGLLMLASAVLLLWPASALLVLVGVLPSLLFSHNFFDSASFQAALGMALAIDRLAAGATTAVQTAAPGGPHHAA